MMTALLILAVSLAAAPVQELAAADLAYRERGDATQLATATALLDEAERTHGDDPEVLWRQARLLVWKGEQTSHAKAKADLGRRAYDTAMRAAQLAPERVEGHYYAALGIGQYAIAVGVLTAMTEGVEAKLRGALDAASAADERFDRGGIPATRGRFHASLPWPRFDGEEAHRHLARALEIDPSNLRARWYLAELLIREGEPARARQLLNEVLASSDAADPAGGAHVAAEARETLSRLDEVSP